MQVSTYKFKVCGTSCLTVQLEVMELDWPQIKEIGLGIRASRLPRSILAKPSGFTSWLRRAFDFQTQIISTGCRDILLPKPVGHIAVSQHPPLEYCASLKNFSLICRSPCMTKNNVSYSTVVYY